MNLFIDIIGWIASVLIVGAYLLNIRGKWSAQSLPYIWCNLIGGAFFIANTAWHKAYPSALVNLVWVVIALVTLYSIRRKQQESKKG
jgi:hypothetical protein